MRADRLLHLLMLLQRHRRLTAGWLATELEVSQRTVLRDMEALSGAGIPVYTERGKGGGCVLMEGFTTQASGLTPGEAQALFAWASRETAADLGLGAQLTSALAKISATAPSGALQRAEAMGEVVIADRRRWFAAGDEVPWLPVLREAASAGRRVRVQYASAEEGAPSTRTLDPIGIIDNSGRWYLLAEHRGEVRTYRVSRMSEVVVLDQPTRLVDRRPIAEIWAERRSVMESRTTALECVVSVDPASAGKLRRLLSMQLAAGTSIEELDGPPDRLHWRLWVRQGDVMAAVAAMSAPDILVLSPNSLHVQIRAAANRALDHYPL